jgi:hypothetical protein
MTEQIQKRVVWIDQHEKAMPGSKKRGRLTQHGETPPEAAIRDEDSRTESVTTESIAEQSSANGSRCLADLLPLHGQDLWILTRQTPKDLPGTARDRRRRERSRQRLPGP